jgi:hypothetical protein
LEHRQYIYTIEEDEKLKVLFDMLEEDNEQWNIIALIQCSDR